MPMEPMGNQKNMARPNNGKGVGGGGFSSLSTESENSPFPVVTERRTVTPRVLDTMTKTMDNPTNYHMSHTGIPNIMVNVGYCEVPWNR